VRWPWRALARIDVSPPPHAEPPIVAPPFDHAPHPSPPTSGRRGCFIVQQNRRLSVSQPVEDDVAPPRRRRSNNPVPPSMASGGTGRSSPMLRRTQSVSPRIAPPVRRTRHPRLRTGSAADACSPRVESSSSNPHRRPHHPRHRRPVALAEPARDVVPVRRIDAILPDILAMTPAQTRDSREAGRAVARVGPHAPQRVEGPGESF
jgi:hypothetical protein